MNNSISIHNPELLKEWNYEKNKKLGRIPENTSYGNDYKAWWKCKKCNHEWQASCHSRTTNKTGCPVCNHKIVVEGINDIKTLYPELMNEWDYDKNSKNNIFPNQVSKSSDKKAWWICPLCNHSYYTAVKYRTKGTSCPLCANESRTSFQEQAIYYYLKNEFEDTINRWTTIGSEVDIFIPCMNIGIEYDGFYYHNNEESNKREQEKYNYLKKNQIKLIRIKEKEQNYTSHADYTLNINNYRNDKEIERIINEIFKIIENIFNYKIEQKINIEKDRQKIYQQYIKQRKDNSITVKNPEILNEWDYTKNKISPNSIVPGSEKKVWWICTKGHSYSQQVASHIKGARCPYCAHQKVIFGETDLQTKYPEIAKEWDFKKNKLLPTQIMAGSDKKFWWICPKGHSYEASVYHRTEGKNCPYCCGKKVLKGFNDLKSQRPELLKQWDYQKNKTLPEEYTCGSNKKVWWKCDKCNNSYETVIHSKTKYNTGCPICNGKKVGEGFNDFLSQQPILINDWNYEKNNAEGIYPNKIHKHSWKKVWWKCHVCDYEWQATPGYRSEGSGCKNCYLNKVKKNTRN